jgi:hypothetical protein
MNLLDIFRKREELAKANPYLQYYNPMQRMQPPQQRQAPAQRPQQQPTTQPPRQLDNLMQGQKSESCTPGSPCDVFNSISPMRLHPLNLLMDQFKFGMNARGMPPPIRGVAGLVNLFRR